MGTTLNRVYPFLKGFRKRLQVRVIIMCTPPNKKTGRSGFLFESPLSQGEHGDLGVKRETPGQGTPLDSQGAIAFFSDSTAGFGDGKVDGKNKQQLAIQDAARNWRAVLKSSVSCPFFQGPENRAAAIRWGNSGAARPLFFFG